VFLSGLESVYRLHIATRITVTGIVLVMAAATAAATVITGHIIAAGIGRLMGIMDDGITRVVITGAKTAEHFASKLTRMPRQLVCF
jgi:hypothetical protein